MKHFETLTNPQKFAVFLAFSSNAIARLCVMLVVSLR